MNVIRNKEEIEKAAIHLQNWFTGSAYPFTLESYEKGEFLTMPGVQLNRLLFVVKGSVRIYGLEENADMVSVGIENIMLGDMEYCGMQTMFYTEANEDVLCLALDIESNRPLLEKDTIFLNRMLKRMAERTVTMAHRDLIAQNLEQKVLRYMQEHNGVMRGVGSAALQLNASRRQLQRVLSKLCDSGTLVRKGKGLYIQS